jgi:hypothetical protein
MAVSAKNALERADARTAEVLAVNMNSHPIKAGALQARHNHSQSRCSNSAS